MDALQLELLAELGAEVVHPVAVRRARRGRLPLLVRALDANAPQTAVRPAAARGEGDDGVLMLAVDRKERIARVSVVGPAGMTPELLPDSRARRRQLRRGSDARRLGRGSGRAGGARRPGRLRGPYGLTGPASPVPSTASCSPTSASGRSCSTIPAPMISSPPNSCTSPGRSASSSAASATPTTGSKVARIAARGAPSRRMPVMYSSVGTPAPIKPASSTGQAEWNPASGCEQAAGSNKQRRDHHVQAARSRHGQDGGLRARDVCEAMTRGDHVERLADGADQRQPDPSASTLAMSPAPATTMTQPAIDKTSASPAEAVQPLAKPGDRDQRHQRRIEVEDEQRERDANALEGDEDAEVEGRVGHGRRGHEPAVAQRNRGQRDQAAAQPRRSPAADQQQDAGRAKPGPPRDQGEAGDALASREDGQRAQGGEQGRRGQDHRHATKVAAFPGAGE